MRHELHSVKVIAQVAVAKAPPVKSPLTGQVVDPRTVEISYWQSADKAAVPAVAITGLPHLANGPSVKVALHSREMWPEWVAELVPDYRPDWFPE
jgi:hypothetical protein